VRLSHTVKYKVKIKRRHYFFILSLKLCLTINFLVPCYGSNAETDFHKQQHTLQADSLPQYV